MSNNSKFYKINSQTKLRHKVFEGFVLEVREVNQYHDQLFVYDMNAEYAPGKKGALVHTEVFAKEEMDRGSLTNSIAFSRYSVLRISKLQFFLGLIFESTMSNVWESGEDKLSKTQLEYKKFIERESLASYPNNTYLQSINYGRKSGKVYESEDSMASIHCSLYDDLSTLLLEGPEDVQQVPSYEMTAKNSFLEFTNNSKHLSDESAMEIGMSIARTLFLTVNTRLTKSQQTMSSNREDVVFSHTKGDKIMLVSKKQPMKANGLTRLENDRLCDNRMNIATKDFFDYLKDNITCEEGKFFLDAFSAERKSEGLAAIHLSDDNLAVSVCDVSYSIENGYTVCDSEIAFEKSNIDIEKSGKLHVYDAENQQFHININNAYYPVEKEVTSVSLSRFSDQISLAGDSNQFLLKAHAQLKDVNLFETAKKAAIPYGSPEFGINSSLGSLLLTNAGAVMSHMHPNQLLASRNRYSRRIEINLSAAAEFVAHLTFNEKYSFVKNYIVDRVVNIDGKQIKIDNMRYTEEEASFIAHLFSGEEATEEDFVEIVNSPNYAFCRKQLASVFDTRVLRDEEDEDDDYVMPSLEEKINDIKSILGMI